MQDKTIPMDTLSDAIIVEKTMEVTVKELIQEVVSTALVKDPNLKLEELKGSFLEACIEEALVIKVLYEKEKLNNAMISQEKDSWLTMGKVLKWMEGQSFTCVIAVTGMLIELGRKDVSDEDFKQISDMKKNAEKEMENKNASHLTIVNHNTSNGSNVFHGDVHSPSMTITDNNDSLPYTNRDQIYGTE